MKLMVEYVPLDTLTPYENNAKIHTDEQIEQIANSISEFGMNDPIAVWGEKNLIIEGHGRLMACRQLGIKEVPIIRLDDLTDEQRRAYTLVHNQTTMTTGFDLDILTSELSNIEIDMSEFGFDDFEVDIDEENTLTDDKYTTKVDVPHYQITGENPPISELVDTTKSQELIKKIQDANISEEQKSFLINASYRHNAFNYSKIAEYYAHQDKEMQELMEESALVIIDFDDAIKNGYVELRQKIEGFEQESAEDMDDEE